MNNPLSVSPSKGNQGTTRGKEKIFWPRWESDSHRGQKIFFFTSCGSLIPFTRANAQWDIHGFNYIALKFTLQSQLSVSPFVFIVLVAQHSYVPKTAKAKQNCLDLLSLC